MSTFDRWNKMAGLLNESAEPQQTVEAEETQTSTMNESDLRGMIAELAKGMLSEGMLDYIKKGDSMAHVFDPAAGWSPVKQMQWGLALLGYLDPNSFRDVDGKFGPKTKKAVERFQKQMGLKPDGVWGPKTNAAFVKAAEGQIAAGMQNPKHGTITDPSPGPSNLGTVNATKQWLVSWLEHSNLDGKVLRMGRTRKKSAPAAPKAPETPASDMTVADAEMPNELDAFLDKLDQSGGSNVADAVRELGAAAREAGDPVPYDPDPSSMRFLPGLEPSLFQNAMVVKDEFGQPGTLLVVKGDWETLGKPKLEKIRKALGFTSVGFR
jgi:hypothetical protein